MLRIQLNRSPEGFSRLSEREPRAEVPQRASFQVGLAPPPPHRARLCEAALLLRPDRHSDVPRDLVRELVLQRQHVRHRTGESVAPQQVLAGKRIEKLGGNAYLP